MSEDTGRVHMRKSPGLAGLLSCLPGMGQVYVGYYTAGFTNILIVGALITLLASGSVRGIVPFVVLFLAFFWLFNIIDAVRKAKLYNLSVAGEREQLLPTDSPLVAGVILILIGLIMTLHITFDLSMEWMEDLWPMAFLAVGLYLIWKYRKTQKHMREHPESYRVMRTPPSTPPSPPAPPTPPAPERTDFTTTSSSSEGTG